MHNQSSSPIPLLTLVLISTLPIAACDVDRQAQTPAQDIMQNITNQVATDAVKQYMIAKRNGATPIDICVQAGFVSAAYLQAQDESNYSKWKSIEKSDCEYAGVPR